MTPFSKKKRTAFPYFLLIISLFSSPAAAVGSGIRLCIEQLIPSLFFFLIAANLLPVSTGTKRRFHLPPGIFSMLVLSVIGGYPIGAMQVEKALSERRISPKQAKLFSCILFGCGPGFLAEFVGLSLLGSRRIGILMLLCQIAGTLILLFGYALSAPKASHEIRGTPPTAFPTLSDSIMKALKTMANICGTVVFFYALRGMLNGILSTFPDKTVQIITALSEVTSGCAGFIAFSGEARVLCLLFFCCFGGICVHLQIYGILGKNAPPYGLFLLFRILHGGLSCGLLWGILRLFPHLLPAADCFTPVQNTAAANANSPMIIILLFITTVLFLQTVNGAGAKLLKTGRKKA